MNAHFWVERTTTQHYTLWSLFYFLFFFFVFFHVGPVISNLDSTNNNRHKKPISLSLSHRDGAPFLARLRALRFDRTLGFCIRVCVRVRLALSAPRLLPSRENSSLFSRHFCMWPFVTLCVSFWILVKTLGCVRCCEKEVRSKGPYVLCVWLTMTLMARRASDLRPATAQNPPLKDSSAQCYTLDWERSLCKSKLETSIRLPAICPFYFFPFGVGFF